jgi:Domain of unknown function (DUF4333)
MVRVVRTLPVVLAAMGVFCWVPSGCSLNTGVDNVPTVSRDAMQRDIRARLSELGEQPASVTCNDDLVGEVGKTARCEVAMSPTNIFETVIEVTDVHGSTIKYEMTPAVSKAQLEKTTSRLVTERSGFAVESISCASGLEGRVDAVAYCDVDAGGVQLRRTVEMSDVNGLMMTFDVVPVLTKAEIETSLLDALEQRVGARPVSAECAGNLDGKVGHTVDCTVAAGPATTAYTLTVTTVDGSRINFSYEPKS